jgi:hypothetical protein
VLKTNTYHVLMRKFEVKRTFLTRGRSWMNNIKIHRKEVGWGRGRLNLSASG